MKRPIIIILLILALALVCAGIGAVVFFTANGGFPTNNPFDVRNISSGLEESKTLKVDADKPITLKVIDASGGVTVTGADVDTVQVKVVKTAYDSTQARADEEVKGIKYSIEQKGNAITLKYELPKSMNFNNKVNTVDFIVTVPAEVNLDIDGGMGEVNVADTIGNVEIRHDFGGVVVENLEGSLLVKTSSGQVNATSIEAGNTNIELISDFGSLTLKNANGGDISLDSSSGTITLDDVRATGDISAQSDFGKAFFKNGSADSLSISTNGGAVSLIKIRVSKEIKVQNDFGEIQLEQATAASYDLHTSSGSISVDGVKGELKAHTDFGGITVQNAQSVTLDLKTSSGTVEFSGALGKGPHMVRTDFGEINLTLPADSKLNVDLSTEFGDITSDLPITVTLTETSHSDGDQIVGSINGGGDQFTAQTSSGSVNLYAEK
jgi:DUF4097 and DUF4098 domain-containing protein YvlB